MEGKTNTSDVALYKLMTDAYTQRYKLRSWIFRKVLKHMLSKIKDEPTIYFLMQTVKENRQVSK